MRAFFALALLGIEGLEGRKLKLPRDKVVNGYSSNPWFNRGGNYNNGTNAGVFNFNNTNGNSNSNNSFRPVLALP